VREKVSMKIDCYLLPGCASEDALRKNLSEAIRLEGKEIEVNVLHVDEAKARELGLKGSPTVLINGIEFQPLDEGGSS
jgi:hypothetical protein